jgi:hypothetical protein
MFYHSLALFLMTSSLAHAAPELICFQDFIAETGSEVFDASRIFIRIKSCSCGASTCTVGASAGGWNPGIELHGSSYCNVTSNPDGTLFIKTRDSELSLSVGESGPRDAYFKSFVRPAQGTLRYDQAGRAPRFIPHRFNCYFANSFIRALPEWNVE